MAYLSEIERKKVTMGSRHLLKNKLAVLLVAVLITLPICAICILALFPQENIWGHLVRTSLPRYLSNTLILTLSVGAMAATLGTSTAWCVTKYDFWGRRSFEWMLLLPLGVPAYVAAYALVDFLEYAGPVQTGLRAAFGWQDSRDYWFPNIRSMGGAILVLGFALYPYVYLLARQGFREQSQRPEEVAQALGASAFRRFFKISLPLIRPSVVAGIAIVMMETVSDFGTVDFFAVQTLTTGIFSVWLQSYNIGGAAQIALVAMALILLLLILEKHSRKRMRFFALNRGSASQNSQRLHGRAAAICIVVCGVPVVIGFVAPISIMLSYLGEFKDAWTTPELQRALFNTLKLGALAAILTVSVAVLFVFFIRRVAQSTAAKLLSITAIGYAAPGAVLGIGVLIPLAYLDNALADLVERVFGQDIGLILTGTVFVLLYAYMVRFFAIAQGAAETAFGRVPPNIPAAARALGHSHGRVLWSIHLPMMRGSLIAAMLLVFVDTVKELPATLLLRPFNFETLATRVHDQASLENLSEAIPGSLLITVVGLVAVLLLARSNR